MPDMNIQEVSPDRDPSSNIKVVRAIVTAASALFCLMLLAVFCYNFMLSSGTKVSAAKVKAADVQKGEIVLLSN